MIRFSSVGLLSLLACLIIFGCGKDDPVNDNYGYYDTDSSFVAISKIVNPRSGGLKVAEEGMAVYGDTVVILNSGGIYRMFKIIGEKGNNSIQWIDEGKLDTYAKDNHANNAFFSNEFYDSNDELPLMYVSTWQQPQRCYVERYKNRAFTKVQTIVFSPKENAKYYSNFVYDPRRNLLFDVSYKGVYVSKEMKVSAFRMPDIRKDSVILKDENVVDSFTLKFPSSEIWQGICIHNLSMYILYGGGTGSRGFYKVDLRTHEYENFDFTNGFKLEPEGLAVFNNALIFNTNGGAIYYLYHFKEKRILLPFP